MSETPPSPSLSSEEGFRLLRQWSLALNAAARRYPDAATLAYAQQTYRETRDWYRLRGDPIPLELSGGPDIQIRHRARALNAERRRRFVLYGIGAAAIILLIVLLVRSR